VSLGSLTFRGSRYASFRHRNAIDQTKSFPQVVNYKKAQIDYISLENSQLRHDIIRANPKWHNGGPRYDYVLMNRDHESISCVQVLGLFTVTSEGNAYPTAFVRPMNIRPRSNRHGFHECTRGNDFEFIPTESLIRSVYVQYDPTAEDKYFINDTIDSDIFLRLRVADMRTY
jgi:hypothetical protein